MRSRLIPVLTLSLLAPLAQAAQRVTVAQMEQILSADGGLSDDVMPSQLAGFALTERVTAERLAAWQARFPGTHTRNMLLILADGSAFYSLPASDVSPDPPPDASAQKKIFDSAVEYANRTIHNLPNLLAVRQTLHFQTAEASLDAVMEQARDAAVSAHQDAATSTDELVGLDLLPLSFTVQVSAPVTYRDGREALNGETAAAGNLGFTTSGEFGPILAIVLGDAEQGSLTWGYWQRRQETQLAVFRYQVPAEKSHYVVDVGVTQMRPRITARSPSIPARAAFFASPSSPTRRSCSSRPAAS